MSFGKHDIPLAGQGHLPQRRVIPADGTLWAATGAASAYLTTEMETAAPRNLCMLLYDGAIRLCREALQALDEGDAEYAAERLAKARRTVHQLQDRAREGTATERQQFSELYERIYRRLVEADFYRRREVVCETLSLLGDRRTEWNRYAQTLGPCPAAAETASRTWIG